MTIDSPDSQTKEGEIAYRDDGKIPMGIWLVWVAFAIFAVIYAYKYAWPDFLAWLQAPSGK